MKIKYVTDKKDSAIHIGDTFVRKSALVECNVYMRVYVKGRPTKCAEDIWALHLSTGVIGEFSKENLVKVVQSNLLEFIDA